MKDWATGLFWYPTLILIYAIMERMRFEDDHFW
ncbi:Hypothetical protein SSA_1600 [Streptococcus sanguinis SK36]|uniref:Uncharacterized protein n=1 Tax=Streptococcus sanguinis (strain SK36) TaxID=388919 RepID=A3CP84_STRSV|nr:Hypothetical protein SSA_1600 [Streptococcus sanguinis SK36]